MSFASLVLPPSVAAEPEKVAAQSTDTEYVLEGSIEDKNVGILRLRLEQLCQIFDQFADHHVYFIHSSQPTLKLKTVRSLINPQLPHKLQYVSDFTCLQQNPFSCQRSIIDVPCSSASVIPFVQNLGFQPNYEYVFKGVAFRDENIRINVGKVYSLYHPGETRADNLRPLTDSHSVEVSTVSATQDINFAKQVKRFAEKLHPLVNLEPVDLRKIAGMK